MGSPSRRRNLVTLSGAVTSARSFMRAPHFGHFSRSIANVRFNSSAHGRYLERCVAGRASSCACACALEVAVAWGYVEADEIVDAEAQLDRARALLWRLTRAR